MPPVHVIDAGDAGVAAGRVLVVDDDEDVRRLLIRILERGGYECTPAGDVSEARALLAQTAFDLLVCDVNLPGESGLDLVRSLAVRSTPAPAAVMVTGLDERVVAEQAVASGAVGYVVKPFNANELLFAVEAASKRRTSEARERRDRERLERAVAMRTRELHAAMEALERSHEETIRSFMKALDYRNEETGGHIERVSDICHVVAKALGMDNARARLLRKAAPMHDIGKIAVPDRILLKPGPLTAEERQEMQRHTVIGHGILAGSGSELLHLAATVALTHHEKVDGTGYPHGLAGDAIPLEGRIAAVADVFDALVSDRVYRAAMPIDAALELMARDRGTHFDPDVFDAFATWAERSERAPAAAS
jgi:putative two-component system response regulator